MYGVLIYVSYCASVLPCKTFMHFYNCAKARLYTSRQRLGFHENTAAEDSYIDWFPSTPCKIMQLVHPQVDKTVAGFTDAGSATLAQGGLYLGGTKYLVIPGDPGAVIRGKKGQVISSVLDA